mmetsp:Transcript_8680/g.27889  ORF Transcript_8680/g.27889 Transcript_8680/m.27889 type:complete len:241 (-) Transcript_8680:111-833(-)
MLSFANGNRPTSALTNAILSAGTLVSFCARSIASFIILSLKSKATMPSYLPLLANSLVNNPEPQEQSIITSPTASSPSASIAFSFSTSTPGNPLLLKLSLHPLSYANETNGLSNNASPGKFDVGIKRLNGSGLKSLINLSNEGTSFFATKSKYPSSFIGYFRRSFSVSKRSNVIGEANRYFSYGLFTPAFMLLAVVVASSSFESVNSAGMVVFFIVASSSPLLSSSSPPPPVVFVDAFGA